PHGHVFLDARVIEASRGNGFLAKRFPTLSARTREAGIDWTREPVPVAPAAHYWMGGVVTDLHGRTSVPGLLAAGEVACTGVQGANRLASNSLLEGLVFGRRAVAAFLGDGAGWVSPDAVPPLAVSAAGGLPLTLASGTPSGDDGQRHMGATANGSLAFDTTDEAPAPISWEFELDPAPGPVETSFADPGPFSRGALRRLMTAKAGVLRTGGLLREAGADLAAWADTWNPLNVPDSLDPREHEDANLLLAAQLLVHAARERRESLGAHYRSDSVRPDAAVEPFDQRYTMSRKASLVQ
ncbi:MAG: FAD-binding protein, partial [Pseudarthrobacter sp.]